MFLKSQKPLVFAVVCGSHSAHSLKLRDNACSAVFECLPYTGGERYHLESHKILATVIASIRKNTWQTTTLERSIRWIASAVASQ